MMLTKEMYPLELNEVIVMHYLRLSLFDRHKIFADKVHFDEFMILELAGSNLVFQNYIRKLTNGKYPFE